MGREVDDYTKRASNNPDLFKRVAYFAFKKVIRNKRLASEEHKLNFPNDFDDVPTINKKMYFKEIIYKMSYGDREKIFSILDFREGTNNGNILERFTKGGIILHVQYPSGAERRDSYNINKNGSIGLPSNIQYIVPNLERYSAPPTLNHRNRGSKKTNTMRGGD